MFWLYSNVMGHTGGVRILITVQINFLTLEGAGGLGEGGRGLKNIS